MKILVVDDEKSIAHLLSEVFKDEGHECECSFSGNSAIEKIKSGHQFDLIISDVRMDDGDGPSLLSFIRSAGMGTKFIFMTGHSDFSEESLKSLGAIKVFHKPLQLDTFIEEVKQFN